MKKILITLISLLAVLSYFTISVFSDTSAGTDVSTILGDRNPTVYFIASIAAQNPTESSTTTVTFNCSVNDQDGNGDITTVMVNFTKTSEITRNATCTAGDVINSTAKNYSCSVNMYFYDATGSWSINVTAIDSGLGSHSNTTESFTYNSLTAWTMSPSSISFGTVYLGQTDASATDDPITLTNTGNSALSGSIKVTALDLKGVTTTTQYIPAANFTVNVNDAHNGDVMINNTAVTISSTSLPKGASSTEDMYVYLEEVPSSGLSYQTYNTAGLGQWTVSTV